MSNNEKHYKISEIENRVINLTLHEILFIDDAITLMIDGRDLEGMYHMKPPIRLSLVAVPIDLIDKIGNAFLEHMRMNKPASQTIPIKISEMELYMLREIAISRVNFNGFKVGLTLKKKVLFALYQKRQSTMDIIEELLKDIDLGENK